MVRLTRAQQQAHTRAAVLVAAKAEFAEHGYVEAKVDRIAVRAELTRGAVYSNFPSKRALYLAALVELVDHLAVDAIAASSLSSVPEAVGAFARVWLERLPLAGDDAADGRLQLRSLSAVVDDPPARTALAQVIRLEALLLALALESHRSRPAEHVRCVRLAELVLTLLNGSSGLAETAPGFGDPFDVARACEHLAGIAVSDTWNPPHLPYVSPARPTDDTWIAPTGLTEPVTGREVDLDADGVIAILGSSRLAAAEEAVRGAHLGEQVTVITVTSDPAEIGQLVRLRVADLVGCLRRAMATDVRLPLRLVLDDRAVVAVALGIPTVDDATEAAVRIRDGKIVARAEGVGAVYAAVTADVSRSARHRRTGT